MKYLLVFCALLLLIPSDAMAESRTVNKNGEIQFDKIFDRNEVDITSSIEDKQSKGILISVSDDAIASQIQVGAEKKSKENSHLTLIVKSVTSNLKDTDVKFFSSIAFLDNNDDLVCATTWQTLFSPLEANSQSAPSFSNCYINGRRIF